MKKIKFFMSLLKERDWLEEMATKGWLLTDITWGMIYHFKKAEPCEKVFEIERFGVSAHPTVQELNARRFAIDVATQSGWEVVTHDEEMNYYFMKDKAGDETDEFYDDAESRRERAERFRKRYSYEVPKELLEGWIFVSVLYLIATILIVCVKETFDMGFVSFFIIGMAVEIALIRLYLKWGQQFYKELSLSREEWDNRKAHSVKKRFSKAKQLYSFLQEQNAHELSLAGYEDGRYLFEKDTNRYNYYVDTKSSLRKRMKKQGNHFKEEKKDWFLRSPKWYETSIADAEQYGLKPVCVIKSDMIIYKRVYSNEKLPVENGNINISIQSKILKVSGAFMLLMIASFAIGFMIGYFS